ncbi:MAG: murein transglycosylase A [Alphaproteobacteria bacterium]|nr:murein transglycosylase A [Alphaproteobacteria bacterium]
MQKAIIGRWFQPKNLLNIVIVSLFIILLNGCAKESTSPAEKQSAVELQKVQISKLSGWQSEKFSEVSEVFNKNCYKILENVNEYIYASAIKIKTKDYQKVCSKFLSKNIRSDIDMRHFIELNFDVYAVTDNGDAVGKFTSYYEAVIRASFEKSGKYKYPIYGKPKDLIEINLKDFDENLPNTRLVGRISGNKFIPYYSRREIENNGIKAPVLMWGDDLVDIHFMQIQGSAVAKMSDGSELRIGFADSNGLKFKGIGSILMEKKLLSAGEVSMPKIREWLRKNPDKAKDLMAENNRFIFQKISDADGPVGALGVSLTAGRSLAVDNQYIPLGAMMWLDTVNPDNGNLKKIVFAQDIGSAIKGVVRGDYFWGQGEQALKHAGRMNSKGKYYIFVPKNSAVKVD